MKLLLNATCTVQYFPGTSRRGPAFFFHCIRFHCIRCFRCSRRSRRRQALAPPALQLKSRRISYPKRMGLIIMRSQPRHHPTYRRGEYKKIMTNRLPNTTTPHLSDGEQKPYPYKTNRWPYLAAIPGDLVRAFCLSSNA